ncbi:unnamed protein product [Symbiodinium natans]|uniref:Uncharacterized protein n=1 Tax=Symbiodinium natans TaxID=878477 RepID=A0A812JR27_9DINO|nr:unnamed protein product [Symbiodinium natans]
MSFFWECNDEDLLLLGLLGRRGVLRQLPEDVFQRVASFLAPLPNHPAHAGWLCWRRVSAWYTRNGCMDVVHLVISDRCLLKIWLSDPEAFETAKQMNTMLPLQTTSAQSQLESPIVAHVSFRLQPGCDLESVLHGDISILARSSSASVRISGSARIYPWEIRPRDLEQERCAKLCAT